MRSYVGRKFVINILYLVSCMRKAFISCMLTSGGVCTITAVLSIGQRTANLTYNIVNDSDIVDRTYYLSYLLGTWFR